MPPGSGREGAWKLIDLALVAILAAAALILLWLLPEWPLNDEVFYLLAIVAFALRQRAEGKRELPATDGSDTGRTGASPRPLDWVLLFVLGAITLLSVEGLLTEPASLVERIFDSLNTALAGLLVAYLVLSQRAQQHAYFATTRCTNIRPRRSRGPRGRCGDDECSSMPPCFDV